jgi:hypothetical protein
MARSAKSVVYLAADGRPVHRANGPLKRYLLLIPLCVLGILLANAYSLMITNNGLLLSNVFPDLRVLDARVPQAYATFVFASVMQFGIMVLYLLFAVARPLQKFLVLPFLGVLVAVSFYFGFISVHAHSRGDAYLGSLIKRIDNLTAGIEGENRFIALSTTQALEGNLRLAEAARRGEDKTGVARCGSLCQGYYDRAEAIRGQYGHLMVAPAAPSPTQDLRAQWREASALFAAYAGRAQDFDRLLKAKDPSSGYAINASLQRTHERLRQIFGKGMDDRWMLTAHSLRDIGKDISVAVSALISIMPDVINLALSMTIGTLLGMSRRNPRSVPERDDGGPAAAGDRLDPDIGSLPVLPGRALADPVVADRPGVPAAERP